MTVAELIRELRAMPNPNAEVRVRVDMSEDFDPGVLWHEALVEDVRNQGPFVSIWIE